MTQAGRRSVRAGAALLLAAVPLALAAWTGGPGPTAALAADDEGDGSPVAVTIVGIDPVAPQPRSMVDVTVDVTNTGAEALDHYDVELRLGYARVTSRAGLSADAAPTHFSSDVPAGGRWDATGPLRPGASATVTLRFAPDQVQHQQPHPLLTAPGVYRLGVEVHDTDAGNRLVGIQNTFLPWLPTAASTTGRLRIAWLWPFVDRPRIGPDGLTDPEGLTAQLRPGGRLEQLLALARKAGEQHGKVRLPVPPAAAAPATKPRPKGKGPPPRKRRPVVPTLERRPVPVSYAVDPALVEALATLAAQPGPPQAAGSTSPPAGTPSTAPSTPPTSPSRTSPAAAYLDALRTQLTTSNLIALPYADPDQSALVRHGAGDQLRSADNARDAVLAANRFPRAVLGIAWPASGYLSPAALAQLTAPYVVLDGRAAPAGLVAPGEPRDAAPTALAQLSRAGGPITAMLADPTLGQLATTQVTSETGALVEQRFAAETALLALEAGNSTGDVVVALPHRFDPGGTAVSRLLTDSGVLPWLAPATVGTLLEAAPPPAAGRGLRYPGAVRRAELPADYVDALAAAAGSVRDLRDLACSPAAGGAAAGRCGADQLALPLEHALLACGSAAWQDDLGTGRQLLAQTAARAAGYLAKVRITTAGTVTLVSQSGSIPITIANDLPLPVTVRLDITTPNKAQLRVGGRRLYVVPPGAKSQQTIQARTSSAGKARFPIYVQLETPSGAPVGERTELVVRSSAYGTIAVVITAGALAVLFGAVAVRLTRTALRARRGAGAGQ
ncbi:MAG: DUF6049 family protein [Frankiaceae bacterium]